MVFSGVFARGIGIGSLFFPGEDFAAADPPFGEPDASRGAA